MIHTGERKIHQVFHQDISDILGADKPCLQHGKTCLHNKYQKCSYHNPDGINGHGIAFCRRLTGKGQTDCPSQQNHH